MKSNKLAFAASAIVLALWASNVKAVPELPFQFEKLNFSLVALQQELGNSGPYGDVVLPNIETSKITSKDLLKYLATALNTNWPAGAQLALGEMLGEIEVPSGQAYGPLPIIWDIFVVDKTGTNPVFDVSTGINVGDTNVVYFSYDSDGTVFSIKGVSLEKTKEVLRVSAETQFGKIFFHLFDEQNGITNTDLYFDGLNTIKFHSNMASTTNKIIEHGTTSEKAPVTGDGTFNDKWTVVKGKVTGSEKWERYGIAGPPIPPTNRPPIINTNIIIPHTNIFIFTNRPPRAYPTTNPPPPIRILNP
jgi:hypothetical protein